MSYDLAVWEGTRPRNGEEAARLYEELMDADEERAEHDLPPEPLTPPIDALLTEVTSRWPDGVDMDEESPWAMSNLRDDASGRFAYFCMTTSPRLNEVVAYIGQAAGRHGLVCYDPQSERVIS